MIPMKKWCRGSVLGLIVGVMAGCVTATPASQFYVLAGDETLTPLAQNSPLQGKSIAVGLVEIAPYLDCLQIVTKASCYKLEMAEFNQWAEPLRDNLSRVVRENLAKLLGNQRISAYPSRSAQQSDIQISIEVLRMDVNEANHAVLVVRWDVQDSQNRRGGISRRSSFDTVLGENGFDAVAKALSENLNQLSLEIAKQLISNDAGAS